MNETTPTASPVNPMFEQPATVPALTTVCIYSGYIAGVRHALQPEKEDSVKPNDPIGLVLEPANRFDSSAIRVAHSAVGKLGYIPRESTFVFHELRALKILPRGVVIATDFHKPDFPKILVRFFIDVVTPN